MAAPQLSIVLAGTTVAAASATSKAATVNSTALSVTVTGVSSGVKVSQPQFQVAAVRGAASVTLPQQIINVVANSAARPPDTQYTQTIYPAAGQTSFILDFPPVPLSVRFGINNAQLFYGIDFTLSGSTLMLLPALGYSIAASDVIQASYQKMV